MTEAAAPTEVRCPLCGKLFLESEASACVFCRRRAGCGMTACPRCGHEFPVVPPGGAARPGSGRPGATGRR